MPVGVMGDKVKLHVSTVINSFATRLFKINKMFNIENKDHRATS